MSTNNRDSEWSIRVMSEREHDDRKLLLAYSIDQPIFM